MQEVIRKHSSEPTEVAMEYGSEDGVYKIVSREVSRVSIDIYRKFADVEQSILNSL